MATEDWLRLPALAARRGPVVLLAATLAGLGVGGALTLLRLSGAGGAS